jgi:hypothetical protein
MLIKKVWIQTTKFGMREWQREGWYLFGFLPLYVRDCHHRGRFS